AGDDIAFAGLCASDRVAVGAGLQLDSNPVRQSSVAGRIGADEITLHGYVGDAVDNDAGLAEIGDVQTFDGASARIDHQPAGAWCRADSIDRDDRRSRIAGFAGAVDYGGVRDGRERA